MSTFLDFRDVNVEIFPKYIDTLEKLVKSINDLHVIVQEVLIEVEQFHIILDLIVIFITMAEVVIAEQDLEVFLMLEVPDSYFFGR